MYFFKVFAIFAFLFVVANASILDSATDALTKAGDAIKGGLSKIPGLS